MKNKTSNIIRFLKAGISLSGIVLLVLHFTPGMDWASKPMSFLATIALPYVPDLFRLFGVKFSKRLEIFYEIFIIPAMVLGIDLDWYKIEWMPYDKIIHGFSGVLAACVGKELLDQASGKPDEKWFKVLFIVSFVAFTAICWECFEFFMDQVFGQSMQQLISVGVADTMWDLISAMIGACFGAMMIVPMKR